MILLWIIAAFIVNPIGEFPVNDDWAYAKSVYYLLTDGVLKFFDWGAMILVAQTLWGALFCKIFGFSFTTLRISVLLLGAAGILFYYFLALRICRKERTAFFSSLVIAFNPLYFSLSNSFMTDVPFLVFLMGALYFSSLYFEKEKLKFIVAAFFFLLTATMIRQTGALMAICLVVAHLYLYPARWRKLIPVLGMGIVVIGILWGSKLFLIAQNILPPSYGKFKDLFANRDWTAQISGLIPNACQMFSYSGLFLFPVLVVVLPFLWKRNKPAVRWIAVVISLLLLIPVFIHRNDFLTGNYVYNLGLIPRILKDTIRYYNWRPMLAEPVLSLVRIFVVFSTFVLFLVLLLGVAEFFRKRSLSAHSPVKIISVVFLAGYTCFVLINSPFYDRYTLPFTLFISLLCLQQVEKTPIHIRIISIVIWAGIVFYTVAATHDFFAFNRARWHGLNDLAAKGIPPKKIDGGFEFNGWYETGPLRFDLHQDKSWYFVDDDEYAVAQGPIPGYKTYTKYTYPAFLTFSTDSILILRRSDSYAVLTEIVCDAESVTADKASFLSSVPGVNFANAETRTDRFSHSGRYSVLLDPAHAFGLTLNLSGVMPGDKFQVSVWTRNNEGKAGIVMAAPDPKYLYFLEKGPATGTGDWQQITLEGTIFRGYTSDKIGIYLWNYGGGTVYFDDLVIRQYRKMN
ncbi:MAG: ArnT family glycosyltransferase [Bacteroidales bacterium]